MLKLSSTLLNIPIMGLQEAAAIGTAVRPLVNPNNLKIEGWFCTQPASKDVLFLPASDIREIARYGLAVNSRQELAPLEEFIRLEKIMRLDYQLHGKLVVTENKKKIGKIEDYAANLDSFYIEKLYVNQKALGAFMKDQLVVSRMQIREITDKKIVIQDIEAFEKSFFKRPLQVPEA